MRLHTLVLILIAGLFLAVIVIAQTAPSESMKNTTAISGANQSPAPTVQATVNGSPGTYVQGELLVQFNQSVFPNNQSMQASSMQANAAIGAVMVTDYSAQGMNGLELVRLPPTMTVEQGIAYYQGLPTVRYAEKNAIYSIANASNQSSGATNPPAVGNTTTTGGLFVRYNQTAFTSTQDMMVFANATNSGIHASVVTDYTPYGLPGLQLVSLQPNTTIDQGLAYYRNITQVLYTEPNTQYQIQNSGKTMNTTPTG